MQHSNMFGSLDLFSGIGALTLALQGLAAPVAYCEIDPHARAVLQVRMQDNSLPRAPVFDDVRTLSAARMRAQGVDGRVDLILAGFPCIGFSTCSSTWCGYAGRSGPA
jgi:site-specific DNA-cytosine methylase